jgi:hypothetical protein
MEIRIFLHHASVNTSVRYDWPKADETHVKKITGNGRERESKGRGGPRNDAHT